MVKKTPFIIAGPCVIENKETVLRIASYLKKLSKEYGIPVFFKSSFDKANRSSVQSYRGPGIQEGLQILQQVKEQTNLQITTDVHTPSQATTAGAIVDIIQIPAFLCRQTDLLLSAGKTKKPVNIKKGQFMDPANMKHAVEKVKSSGNSQVFLTERGTFFGYNNLVVDFRSLLIMKQFAPVIFDCTHSVQLPGINASCSSGQPEFAFPLLRAAVAVGIDGVFFEVHDNPDSALCDGSNMLNFQQAKQIFEYIKTHS